jgi:hypothetical protein
MRPRPLLGCKLPPLACWQRTEEPRRNRTCGEKSPASATAAGVGLASACLRPGPRGVGEASSSVHLGFPAYVPRTQSAGLAIASPSVSVRHAMPVATRPPVPRMGSSLLKSTYICRLAAGAPRERARGSAS